MTEEFPWYTTVDDDNILQGDFIHECSVPLPISKTIEAKTVVKATVVKYNVVVMSQSCDIVNKKLKLILVCPYWELGEFTGKNPVFNHYT